MSPTPQPISGRTWLDILGLSLLWGCAFLFFKVLSASWPPLTVVTGRVGLAAVALLMFMRFRRLPITRDPGIWAQFGLLGLLNNVIPFSMVAAGIRYIPTGLAAIMNTATPIFTVIAAHFLTQNEKLSLKTALGVGLALAGVLVAMRPGAALSQSADASLPGELLYLGAAVSFALAAVFARRFRDLPPLTVATGQLTASTLIVAPLSFFVDRPWDLGWPSAQTWASLLGISLLSSALAYVLFFRIVASAGAAASQLVTFIIPLVAIAIGAIVLEEQLAPEHYIGMVVVAAGLVVIHRSRAIEKSSAPSPT